MGVSNPGGGAGGTVAPDGSTRADAAYVRVSMWHFKRRRSPAAAARLFGLDIAQAPRRWAARDFAVQHNSNRRRLQESAGDLPALCRCRSRILVCRCAMQRDHARPNRLYFA
jgi:hypothetical protein